MTIDVEAKAKALAVLRLQSHLIDKHAQVPEAGGLALGDGPMTASAGQE